MTSGDSKVEKIRTQFQRLSQTASTLNNASDELRESVAFLDEALKKLNVGLTVWITSRSRAVYPGDYDDDQIGYAKINGTWGIALRRIWGNEQDPEREREDGPWLFSDAPRELRLHGVDRIPELIESLASEASKTAKRIQEKAKDVREIAEAIEGLADEAQGLNLNLSKSLIAAAKGALRDMNSKAGDK